MVQGAIFSVIGVAGALMTSALLLLASGKQVDGGILDFVQDLDCLGQRRGGWHFPGLVFQKSCCPYGDYIAVKPPSPVPAGVTPTNHLGRTKPISAYVDFSMSEKQSSAPWRARRFCAHNSPIVSI